MNTNILRLLDSGIPSTPSFPRLHNNMYTKKNKHQAFIIYSHNIKMSSGQLRSKPKSNISIYQFSVNTQLGLYIDIRVGESGIYYNVRAHSFLTRDTITSLARFLSRTPTDVAM